VNRWAERHREELEAALEAGEVLIAADRVMLSSTAAIELEGRTPGQTERLGGRRGGAAVRAARKRGVNLPGRGFVLVVTDRRVVVLTSSTWLARPVAEATAFPRTRVVSIVAGARVGPSRVRVLLDDGTLLVLRPYGGRRIDHLAAGP
jgi:hypothetical protein